MSWALSNLLVAPEKLARLCINSHHALAQALHILFAAATLNDNRRCITRGVATRYRRFPNERARLFVKRHHRGLRAAGRYDNDVTINQMLADLVMNRAGQHKQGAAIVVSNRDLTVFSF